MNKRTGIVIAVFVAMVALLLLVFFWWWQINQHGGKVEVPITTSKSSAPASVVEHKYEWQGTDAQLPASVPGKYDPTLPQWIEYDRRNKEDKFWEWKTPISFYGKIIDQFQNPVSGAKVQVSWNDTSAHGTSYKDLNSDGNGLFSITGIKGKILIVSQIEKEGYIPSVIYQRGFEYSAFFDKNYHIPNPNNPVIFHMHKKVAAEPMIKLSNEITIPSSGTVGINLQNGRQGVTDVHLVIELLDNSDPTGKKWAARVSAPRGGIQPANDEFATIAPISGYQSELTINQDTTLPNGFQDPGLYKGGKFYLKTSVGYALIEFRMIPGNSDFQFSSYLNPNTNSRNLEYDPAKQIKP